MTRKAKIIIGSLIVILAFFFFYYFLHLRFMQVTYINSDASSDEFAEEESYYDESCNIAGINFHGELWTYLPEEFYPGDYASAEDIYAALTEAEDNPQILGIVLEVDSYGGIPVAAEELSNKIRSIKKPVVAVIRGVGASAGYWVASSADRVFASELSDIGSIGVTMSYLDESKLNQSEGYTWNSLSTGKFKDAGSSDKPLTAEERALFERDIKLTFDKFIGAVAENRGLSLEKVRALADGSSMLGKQALANGLIDEIGFMPEAEKYLKSTLSVEPVVCW
jgi:protease-4